MSKAMIVIMYGVVRSYSLKKNLPERVEKQCSASGTDSTQNDTARSTPFLPQSRMDVGADCPGGVVLTALVLAFHCLF